MFKGIHTRIEEFRRFIPVKKPKVVQIKRGTPLTDPEVKKADVVIRSGLVIKDRGGPAGRLPTDEERKLAVKIG